MAKALSEDLRTRLVGAVEEGMSRRAATERFGSRLRVRCALSRNGGRAERPRPSGDQRSQRIEEHHEAIMSAIEAKPDMTLVEIAGMLKTRRGASFAPSSIWCFAAPFLPIR